jgi:alkylation response protein AidB-like acyl-CoA dehydrogenase
MTILGGRLGPLAALDGLAARIEGERAAGAADRRLPDELTRALAEAGLFKLLVPRALGGFELDPLAAAEVVEAAARIDGSVGWAVMIGSQSAWFASFLPPAVADRVLGPPAATLAGALRPGGTAVAVDGGYRVSGRWSLVSGCTYADHLYGSCRVTRPENGARGTSEVRVVYVPASVSTIVDTWRSAGLRATGSHDFTLNDVVVPDEWTLPMPALGAARHDGPLYRDGYQNLAFVLQAAHALGVARGAAACFAELAGTAGRWMSGGPLRDQPTVQAGVARVEARIRSARAWLREAVGDAWDTILAGGPPTTHQRVLVRLAITHAITTAAEAADVLQRAAGSAAVYEDHPLHQRFQDLRAAAAHIQAAPVILEMTGALLLGAATTPNPLL